MNRINADGDYLLVAPKGTDNYYIGLVGKIDLVDGIIDFIECYDVKEGEITIYKLLEINEEDSRG